MVTVNRMGGNVTQQTAELIGLSTDTKPTENIPNGSTFFEIDTMDVYFYNQATKSWITS